VKLKQSGEVNVTLLSQDSAIGGVWRNRKIPCGLVEAFPHVIECGMDIDLKYYEEFFNCQFVFESKQDVVFWYKDRSYKASDRLDAFKLALWQYVNTFDKSKLKRNLSSVITRRNYCIPRLGYTRISDGLEYLCKKYDIQTIHDKAQEISVVEPGLVLIRCCKNEYYCENLYITRGLTDVNIRTSNGNVKFGSNRICRVDYVEARSNVLSRYNKFLDHHLIDRIAKVNSEMWIIQSKFDIEKSVLKSDYYFNEVKRYLLNAKLFSNSFDSSCSSISSAASFNMTDIAFSDTNYQLPTNIKLINSKALSYLLENTG
jgi:hypothetical protein